MGIRLVIAGSKGCDPTDMQIETAVAEILCLDTRQDRGVVEMQLRECVEEVICGCAPGADRAGERWAKLVGVPVHSEPITAEDVRRWGKYAAPKQRNRRMAERATHALCFWDGMSSGTPDMALRMIIRGKPVVAVPCHRRKRQPKQPAQPAETATPPG